jgi:hypothetical protein
MTGEITLQGQVLRWAESGKVLAAHRPHQDHHVEGKREGPGDIPKRSEGNQFHFVDRMLTSSNWREVIQGQGSAGYRRGTVQ